MTRERWRQVKEIFQSALERAPAEREALLNEVCDGDDSLRREVEVLLASFENADDDSFMRQAAIGEVAEIMVGAGNRLAAGQRLNHYEIGAEIGAGGMGEVYLAEDTRLHRKVALKLLPARFTSDHECLARFNREAQAASALNHPNILTVYEIGVENGLYFIATEFIDGETLRNRLRGEQLAIADALDISAQAASALSAAHASGIIHRDIKPENIMIRRDGLVKVLDFGLAKLSGTASSEVASEAETTVQMQTKPGVIMGTVVYMSPEQARGRSVDARTDIWSLGVVLYEMLTGKQPFRGETSSDMMAAILKNQPAPPARFNAEIPDELNRIVLKTLQKDRDERYQVVKDLLLDLKHLKKQLEFEAEREQFGVSSGSRRDTKPAQAETQNDETNTESVNAATTDTTPAVSSAEYLVSEINRHKRGVVAALVVLLMAAIGVGYWLFANRSASRTPIKSIAVLPLENLSGDASQDYFADGMTDAVITELAKIGSLRIISRNSTRQYKATRKKITEIAGELNVDAVIVGTVLRAGDRVRINTQMFRAGSEQSIWSTSYERGAGDVLALQSEVSRGIVGEIKIKLTSEEQAGLARQTFSNSAAQDAYLKGQFYWHQAIYATSPEKIKALFFKSFDYYQEAINIEPNNAQAHAALAEAYHWLGSMGFPEYYPKSKEAALTALRLDETNPNAHGALAWVLWHDEWKFKEAEREMKRVIELNPNDSRHGYALLLSSLGRHDEAHKAIEIGEPLDPLNLAFKANIGWIYIEAQQYQRAEKRLRDLVETNPDDVYSRRALATALAYQGRHEEAIAEQLKVIAHEKANPATNTLLAWFYAMAGRREKAINILDEVKKSPDATPKAVRIARVYGVLGDKEQVFVWLEKAYAAHSQEILYIKTDRSFDSLRDDPRFQDLLRRVGFPQ